MVHACGKYFSRPLNLFSGVVCHPCVHAKWIDEVEEMLPGAMIAGKLLLTERTLLALPALGPYLQSRDCVIFTKDGRSRLLVCLCRGILCLVFRRFQCGWHVTVRGHVWRWRDLGRMLPLFLAIFIMKRR